LNVDTAGSFGFWFRVKRVVAIEARVSPSYMQDRAGITIMELHMVPPIPRDW
jgi:hypothetical protein